jgi:SH3-like domain-containing protein
MMIKQFASSILATFVLTGVMVASSSADLSAQAQTSSYLRNTGCTTLTVSNRVAWLKEQPSLKSTTLRTAPFGETLWVIRDGYGQAQTSNGWYMVRSASGRRYWVHHSVTRCGHVTPTTTYNTYSYQGYCNNLWVNTSHAWLKAGPALSYNTLRVATRGEKLWRVGDRNTNYANQQKDWLNVRTADGNRYWVHQSRVACDVSRPVATAPVLDNRIPQPAAPRPVRPIKNCVDVLQCAVDVADATSKGQYQQWMKQVKDMMNNPLTKLAGEELCVNTMERPVIQAFPACKRN